MKKATLLLVSLLILIASCQPAPTPTPLPPTATAIPPTPSLAPNVSTILTVTAPKTPSGTRGALSQATIRVGNLDRNYLYYVPANLSRNAPLLFVLHGSSADAATIRAMTGNEFETLADQNGFIVAYPNGYRNSWNDCRKAATLAAKTANIDDVGLIHALIAKFRADYGINTSQVFVIGYSNGGHLAFRLAFELADEIAAIAAVSASLPTEDNFDCRTLGKPIPVLIMHGTKDPISPYNGGEVSVPNARLGTVRSAQSSAEYFAKLNGQTTTPKTTRFPHRDTSDPTFVDRTVWNDADKPEVVLVTINEGGHVIPLGKFSTVTFLGVNLGQATSDLDGPAEIWSFFARQRSLK